MFKPVKLKSRLLFGLKKAHADLKIAKFVLFYGPSYADSNVYDLDDYKSLLESSHFDSKKNTVLYLHGYLEDMEIESVHVIADAYLQRKDVNLIVLDWGELADGNYLFDAVPNARQLGAVLSKYLKSMFEMGLNIKKFHIVGHSLGGQMAGMIGSSFYKNTNKTQKIRRITALDPAFPGFYLCGLTYHLNKNDADFVDVIHTDAWLYGAPFSTGTADFWPNGGATLQPGCPKRNYKPLTDNDLSSHRRSWWYWAESVANKYPNHFEAVKAKGWSDFKRGRVIEESFKKKPVLMGHNCSMDISGNYYLQTNGVPPFARGFAGTCYIEPEKLDGYIYAEQGTCTEDTGTCYLETEKYDGTCTVDARTHHIEPEKLASNKNIEPGKFTKDDGTCNIKPEKLDDSKVVKPDRSKEDAGTSYIEPESLGSNKDVEPDTSTKDAETRYIKSEKNEAHNYIKPGSSSDESKQL